MSYTHNRYIVKGGTKTATLLDSRLVKSNFVRITTTGANNTITVKDETGTILGSILLYAVGDTIHLQKHPNDSISSSGEIIVSATNLGTDYTNIITNSELLNSWGNTFGIDPFTGSTTLDGDITASQTVIPVADLNGFNKGTKVTIGTEEVRLGSLTKNMMPHSENFGHSWWTKRGNTTATGSQTDPNGGSTAWLIEGITRTGTYSDFFGYTQNTGFNSTPVAISLWIKKVTQSGVLTIGSPYNNTLYGWWSVDFSKLGDGWERITKDHIAVTENQDWITQGGGFVGAHFFAPSGTTQTWDFYAWGVQIEISPLDIVNDYISTEPKAATNGLVAAFGGVTRGINGTTAQAASDGDSVTTNQVNAIASPIGSVTADHLVDSNDDATNNRLVWENSIWTNASTTYTLSLYAKANINEFVFCSLRGNATHTAGATFNLNTGTVVSSAAQGTGYSIVATSMVDCGSGWYRCVMTAGVGTTVTDGRVQIGPSNGEALEVAGYPRYAGEGQTGVHTWGIQLEEAATVGPYIPTTTAARTETFSNDEIISATGLVV